MICWPIQVNPNKYSRWYENLIEKAISRETVLGYKETHHTIPKSWGGSNTKDNLVHLTAREHYIAHLLLWKMDVPKKHHVQMMYAFTAMTRMRYNNRSYKINSRVFEAIRIEHSNHMKEKCKGRGNPNFGNKMPDTTKQKLKEANLKKYHERSQQKFIGPIRPKTAIEFRGKVYKSRGEASRITGISSGKIKLQIKYWGSSPSKEIITKIDSGELKYPRMAPNKGIPMSEDQKKLMSKNKKKKFAEMKEKGIPLPNIGRKVSDESRALMSQKAMGRKASDEARAKMSLASKGKVKSPEHIQKIKEAKMKNKLNKSLNKEK